jgi:hypothetical protein
MARRDIGSMPAMLPAGARRSKRAAILDVNRCSFLAALGGAGATY